MPTPMPHHQAHTLSRGPLSMAVLTLLLCGGAQAVPLSFYSYAGTSATIGASYSSTLLGDVNFTLNLPGNATYFGGQTGSGASTGLASYSYNIASGQGGTDPVYDIITSSGQYAFSYSGQAETVGVKTHAGVTVSTIDSTTGYADYAANASLNGYAQSSWSQQFYIGADPFHKAGTYGATVVALTMDGQFPALAGGVNNSASAYTYVSTSFVDKAGVSYSSYFTASAYANDPSWTGAITVYKKLLFQYGTPFSVSQYMQVSANANGSADFTHTGYISAIELPYGATLESGAEQAGLGGTATLYGAVTNSATLDAENTNWDFGNNGGGFTPPPVPEPGLLELVGAGLLVTGLLRRRRPQPSQG
jgi:hypothetical protein